MSLPNATLPAREIVEEIMRDHGFLDESTYADMPSHARRKVEEAMLKKDEMIGSSVITYEMSPIVIWLVCELTPWANCTDWQRIYITVALDLCSSYYRTPTTIHILGPDLSLLLPSCLSTSTTDELLWSATRMASRPRT